MLFLLFPILLSCSFQKKENSLKNFANNANNQAINKSINIEDLRINLYIADKKFTPKVIHNNDGTLTYKYIKKLGEDNISLEEVKERVSLGPNFYKKDREDVINLLKRINELF